MVHACFVNWNSLQLSTGICNKHMLYNLLQVWFARSLRIDDTCCHLHDSNSSAILKPAQSRSEKLIVSICAELLLRRNANVENGSEANAIVFWTSGLPKTGCFCSLLRFGKSWDRKHLKFLQWRIHALHYRITVKSWAGDTCIRSRGHRLKGFGEKSCTC